MVYFTTILQASEHQGLCYSLIFYVFLIIYYGGAEIWDSRATREVWSAALRKLDAYWGREVIMQVIINMQGIYDRGVWRYEGAMGLHFVSRSEDALRRHWDLNDEAKPCR